VEVLKKWPTKTALQLVERFMRKCVGVVQLHATGPELQEAGSPERRNSSHPAKAPGRKIEPNGLKSNYRNSLLPLENSETYKLSELRAGMPPQRDH
jgi:hypothetical protein